MKLRQAVGFGVTLVLALLTATSMALAVAINPINTRPVFVNPSGGGNGSEPNLQSLLDVAFGVGAINANTDQQAIGMWRSSSLLFPTSVPTLVFENAGLGNSNIFGIWSGTDSTAIASADIFKGPALPGARAMLSWDTSGTHDMTISILSGDGTTVNTGVFSGIDPSSFGFYLRRDGGPTFYTVDALNAGGKTQAVAYQSSPGSDTWLLAFEDLPFASSDRDYNDMGVRVESIEPVPEPSTMFLLGSGLLAIAALGALRPPR